MRKNEIWVSKMYLTNLTKSHNHHKFCIYVHCSLKTATLFMLEFLGQAYLVSLLCWTSFGFFCLLMELKNKKGMISLKFVHCRPLLKVLIFLNELFGGQSILYSYVLPRPNIAAQYWFLNRTGTEVLVM